MKYNHNRHRRQHERRCAHIDLNQYLTAAKDKVARHKPLDIDVQALVIEDRLH